MVTPFIPNRPIDGSNDWGENGLNINWTNQETFNNEVSTKLDDKIESVNGKTGIAVILTKDDIGLDQVDNISDLNKPISTSTQTALNAKMTTITYDSTSNGRVDNADYDNTTSGLTADNTNDAINELNTNTINHINDTNNPHSVDATDIGLENVQNVDTTTTENIVDFTDKRFVTDIEKTDIGTIGDKLDSVVAGSNITVDNTDPNNPIINSTASGSDELVGASATDTTPDFLDGKISAGSNITITKLNSGGNESLEISASGGAIGTDESVKVSGNDTTAGYLDAKLVAGTGITLVENNDGGNETLTINSTASGGGTVDTVVGGTEITVDATDPANPIVNSTGISYSIRDENVATGVGNIKFWTGTQAEFDAIPVPDASTRYKMTDAPALAVDSEVIHLAGAETVTGAKLFNESISTDKALIVGNNIVDVPISKTLILSDNGFEQKSTSATAIDITVPLNSSVAFPIGAEIPITKYGAGNVTVVATGGVTINTQDNLIIDTQYDNRVLKKMDTDEWLLKKSLVSGGGGGSVTKETFKSITTETNTTTLSEPRIVKVFGDLTNTVGQVEVYCNSVFKKYFFETFELECGADASVDIVTANKGFALSNTSYDSISYSVSTQASSPTDLYIKNDGLKLYILDNNSKSIYEYNVNTAWSMSSVSYTGNSLSLTSELTSPTGFYFGDNGFKLYVIGEINQFVYQYSITTPYSLSTATYSGVSFAIAFQQSEGIFFKPDGLKFYIITSSDDSIHQFNLSTAWDLSTATSDGINYPVSDSSPTDVFFNADGNELYVTGNSSNTIRKHNLLTPWIINTAVFSGVSFSTTGQDVAPFGVCFKDSGHKMYMLGLATGSVYQYTTETTYSGTTYTSTEYGSGLTKTEYKNTAVGTNMVNVPSTVMSNIFVDTTEMTNGTSIVKIDGNIEILTSEKGLQEYVYGADSEIEIELTDEGNVFSSMSYSGNSLDVSTEDTQPSNVKLGVNGDKMYVVGVNTENIYQYTLSTPWDISTAIYDSVSFNLSSQLSSLYDIFFKPDGLKMYTISGSSNTVYQYTLGTAWDISTLSYDSVTYVVGSIITAMMISPDGKNLFTMSNTGLITSYTFGTAWDVSTLSDDSKSFDTSTQDTGQGGIVCSFDGTILYRCGNSNDNIYRYIMTTPFDLDTMIYSGESFDISGQTASCFGMGGQYLINGKLYIIDIGSGVGADTVFEYDMFKSFNGTVYSSIEY